GDTHAVVVDQLDGQGVPGAGHEDDVAVLQIGVRDTGLSQPPGHPRPDEAELLQAGGPVQRVADELVEQQPLDPAHLEDGIPPAADADALLEVLEIDGEGQPGSGEVFADLGVALAQARDLAGEALDRPGVARRALDLVDVGEVAGARHRDAQRVERRLALAQLGVAEAGLRVLDRLVVILRQRPRHWGTPWASGPVRWPAGFRTV